MSKQQPRRGRVVVPLALAATLGVGGARLLASDPTEPPAPGTKETQSAEADFAEGWVQVYAVVNADHYLAGGAEAARTALENAPDPTGLFAEVAEHLEGQRERTQSLLSSAAVAEVLVDKPRIGCLEEPPGEFLIGRLMLRSDPTDVQAAVGAVAGALRGEYSMADYVTSSGPPELVEFRQEAQRAAQLHGRLSSEFAELGLPPLNTAYNRPTSAGIPPIAGSPAEDPALCPPGYTASAISRDAAATVPARRTATGSSAKSATPTP